MKAFRKILAGILIAAVFISANGVVLAIHKCIASSSQSVSLFEKSCTCNKEHKGECHDKSGIEIKSKCCSYQVSYFKLNIPTVIKKVQQVDMAVTFSFFKNYFFPKQLKSIAEVQINPDTSQPDLLSFICKLVI